MADKSRILLKEIECNYCHSSFYLCRKHYRGHRYCSDECRKAAREEAKGKAQNKYRTSDKGREKNSEGAKRRRKKGGSKKNKKNVADQGSTPPTPCIILYPTRPGEMPRCLICGVYGEVVKKFPPRGYGCGKRKRDTENTSGEGRADTTERTRCSEETSVLESGSCCGYCGKPLYEKKIELPFGRKRELSIILPVNEEVARPDESIQEGVARPGKQAQKEASQPDEPVREKGPRIDEPVKKKVTPSCGPTQEEAPQSGEPAKEEAPQPSRPVRGGKCTERCEPNRAAMEVKNDGSCRKDEP